MTQTERPTVAAQPSAKKASKDPKDPKTPEIRYAEAMSELETIVLSLEEDEPDIDDLANKVERASVLIAACRGRLEVTKERIAEISGSIEPR